MLFRRRPVVAAELSDADLLRRYHAQGEVADLGVLYNAVSGPGVAVTPKTLPFVAALLTFLAVGEYTRKARLSGVLVPDRGGVRLRPDRAASPADADRPAA